MHHFDIETGQSVTSGSWGYRLYYCGTDYSVYEDWGAHYGYGDEDEAHLAACRLLDREYGKGNWTF